MSNYDFLLKKYPDFVTKEQFWRICHISKNTAKYYLENGYIPCVTSDKKTHRYKISIRDIIFFLTDRDENPSKYYLPNHFNNPFLPSEVKQYKPKPQHRAKDCCKLKGKAEVGNYKKYLELQFSEYPDMMSAKQILQVTGHTTAVILQWCKTEKVKYIICSGSYLLQKKSVVAYLFSRE
jgi:hypothetical protein